MYEPLLTSSPSFRYPLTCCTSGSVNISSLLPNKSSFQITGVVRRCSQPTVDILDVNDDNNSGEDHIESDLIPVDSTAVMSFGRVSVNGLNTGMESSKTSAFSIPVCECDAGTLHVITEMPLSPLSGLLTAEMKRKASEVCTSRFRIVKIESKEQFKRGRWTCRDFADPPEAKVTEKTSANCAIGGIDESATKAVYYVPDAGCDVANSQFIFYQEGHPVLESDALPAGTELFAVDLTKLDPSSLIPQASCSNDGVGKTSDVGSSITETDELGDMPPRQFSDLDSVLWRDQPNRKSWLSLISSSDSRADFNADMSATSSFEIDNKIEQAMDLVKTHLMFAVRAEVEELKEQIKELMLKNSRLEYENNLLRASASRDVLATLDTASHPQPPSSR